MVPVESQRAQAELNTIFDPLLSDNQHAWELGADGRWTRLQPSGGKKAKVAQLALMRRASCASGGRPSTGTVTASAFLGRWFVRPVRRETIRPMRVAVIDVGSNTARLMVAEQGGHGTSRVGEAKVYLGLGAEILRHGSSGARSSPKPRTRRAASRRSRSSSAPRRSTSSSPRRPARPETATSWSRRSRGRPATSPASSRRRRKASSPTRARSRRPPSSASRSPCATSAAARPRSRSATAGAARSGRTPSTSARCGSRQRHCTTTRRRPRSSPRRRPWSRRSLGP